MKNHLVSVAEEYLSFPRKRESRATASLNVISASRLFEGLDCRPRFRRDMLRPQGGRGNGRCAFRNEYHLPTFKAAMIFSCLLGLSFQAGCSINPNISAGQMAEQAKFQTYVFDGEPAWADQSQITHLDFFGTDTFMTAYRAADGRHVVLAQSKKYEKLESVLMMLLT